MSDCGQNDSLWAHFELFFSCSDSLWLKWVTWFIRGFLWWVLIGENSEKSKSYLNYFSFYPAAWIMGKFKQLFVIIFTGLCFFTIWSTITPRFMISEMERERLRTTLTEYSRLPSQLVQWNPSCIRRWDSDCVRKYVLYSISLLISNSVDNFELNQYQNSQMIMLIRFHFMRYFVNSIIFLIQKA